MFEPEENGNYFHCSFSNFESIPYCVNVNRCILSRFFDETSHEYTEKSVIPKTKYIPRIWKEDTRVSAFY